MKIGKISPFLLAPLAGLLLASAPIDAPSFPQQLASAASLVDAGKTDDALTMLDAMLKASELPLEKGQIEGLRSFALARANRIPEARKAIEMSIANSPAPSILLLRQLFLLRAFDGDPKGAGDTLLLIAATDAKGLNTLPTQVVSDVMRAAQGDKDRAFELDYAMVTAGWSPPDSTLADLDWLRLRLVTELVERGRIDDARPVVAAMLSPVVLIRLGIDRRFAKLWPEIEARLGPGADIADAAYVGATKARFDKEPNSLIARLGYVEALNIASQEPDALVVADVAKTPEALAALSDREIWLVNLQAELLGDAGKGDAALAWLSRQLLLARIYPDYFHAQHMSAWPVLSGFDLLAALTLALATMMLGVMGGFALVFVPPWIVFRRAQSWRRALFYSSLIGAVGYVAAFAIALGLDQPFGPVLALLLIALGLLIA